VKEAEGESDGDRDEHVEEELAEAGGPVAVAKAKAVPDAGEAADGEEGVKAGVKEGELAECGEFVGPGGLEPAEVDGEAERNEDEEIEKVAALAGVEAGGEEFEGGDESGEEEIDEEPANGQDVRVEGDDDIGQDEDCGNSKAQQGGERLRGADAAFAAEGKGKERNEEENEGDGGGKDGKREGHETFHHREHREDAAGASRDARREGTWSGAMIGPRCHDAESMDESVSGDPGSCDWRGAGGDCDSLVGTALNLRTMQRVKFGRPFHIDPHSGGL